MNPAEVMDDGMITVEQLIAYLQKVKRKYPGIKVLFQCCSDYTPLKVPEDLKVAVVPSGTFDVHQSDDYPKVVTAIHDPDFKYPTSREWVTRWHETMTDKQKERAKEYLVFPGN